MATLQELRSYRDALCSPEAVGEPFPRLVAQGLTLLGLSDAEVAREFDLSRPSVTRWRDGKAAPHPAMRRHVLAYLVGKIDRALRK